MKLPVLLLFLIVLISANTTFSQVDIKDSFIDSCAKKWHIQGEAMVIGYGIQSQPYIKDSITIYVRFGPDYTQYGFKGQFMDSLLLKNRYLIDEDAEMKRIIQSHKITFPPPPASSQ